MTSTVSFGMLSVNFDFRSEVYGLDDGGGKLDADIGGFVGDFDFGSDGFRFVFWKRPLNEPVAGPEGGEKGVVDVLRPAESSASERMVDQSKQGFQSLHGPTSVCSCSKIFIPRQYRCLTSSRAS
ncbi:MAG: hypothetical protein WEB53_16560 [Akkermansiaceae bacterium]